MRTLNKDFTRDTNHPCFHRLSSLGLADIDCEAEMIAGKLLLTEIDATDLPKIMELHPSARFVVHDLNEQSIREVPEYKLTGNIPKYWYCLEFYGIGNIVKVMESHDHDIEDIIKLLERMYKEGFAKKYHWYINPRTCEAICVEDGNTNVGEIGIYLGVLI